VILYFSPRFAEHTPPPGHPERAERANVFQAVADAWRSAGGQVCEPGGIAREALLRVHTAALVDDIASRAGRPSMIDADTFTSPESYDVALLAAGASLEAAFHAVERSEPAFALVRPPGHHAEPDRAMGFCLFNNIAVAAAGLRATGLARVAIVDMDVHHGNGTQAAFYSDPAVFYASTHQFPYYPGTGAASEQGSGEGLGTTLNVPLAAGTEDRAFVRAYEQQVVPALERFRPDAVLVSAGFDAHHLDPLGGLRVTTDGYRQVVSLLDDASRRLCERRSVWVTEGGYHLGALRECLDAAIGVLS
jgi:acetoin utilization deacetylase AcuC-like enzyme